MIGTVKPELADQTETLAQEALKKIEHSPVAEPKKVKKPGSARGKQLTFKEFEVGDSSGLAAEKKVTRKKKSPVAKQGKAKSTRKKKKKGRSS